MNTLIQDLRYGIRMLARNPGFTAIAALILAVGIGANTIIFSVFNAVFLQPVPVPEPDRMVRAHEVSPLSDRYAYASLSYPDYADYRDQATSFSGLTAFADIGEITFSRSASVRGGSGQAELASPVSAMLVSGNYFDVLRASFVAGRGFLSEEDLAPGTHPVAILSHSFWQRQWGAEPSVVGRSIILNGRVFFVVGVAAKDFRITRFGGAPDIWLPLMMQPQLTHEESRLGRRDYYWLQVEARLKPDITRSQAQQELASIAGRLDEQYPRPHKRQLAVLAASLYDPNDVRGQEALITVALFSGPGLLLLIACANVGNLLLAKATGRSREMAIRLSQGATRLRLVKQLITEGVLLSLIGGVGALLISMWLSEVFATFMLGETKAGNLLLTPDRRVASFVVVVCLLAPILFALAPALRASGLSISKNLKLGGGQSSAGKSRLQNFFVASQVALSVILLIVAGLLVRSLYKAVTVEPGIELKKTVAIHPDLRRQGYGDAQAANFLEALRVRLQAYSGVQAVGAAMNVPASGSVSSTSIQLADGGGWDEAQKYVVSYNLVSPTFFNVIRLPLLRGKSFTDEELRQGAPVAIVTEAAARRLWPGEDPIGQRYRNSPSAPWIEVVGVVPNVRNSVIVEDEPDFYQLVPPGLAAANVLVRTAEDPAGMLADFAAEVHALDGNLQPQISILLQSVGARVTGETKLAILAGTIGGLALFLTAIGLYGVVSFLVGQRTNEMGIRMALGADGFHVVRLIVFRGLRLIFFGVLVGLGTAMMVTQALRSLLFDVTPTDPVTFAGVSLLLALVTLLACYIPARRAARVDPMDALRHE